VNTDVCTGSVQTEGEIALSKTVPSDASERRNGVVCLPLSENEQKSARTLSRDTQTIFGVGTCASL